MERVVPRGGTAAGVIGVLGLVAYAAHLVLAGDDSSQSGFFDDWVYNGLIGGAAAVCIARVALVRDERPAWIALSVALVFWFAGEVYWSAALSDAADPPAFSPSDAFFLAFYPAAYTGLVLLVRSRVRRLPLGIWLDGAIGALAIAALGTGLLFEPALAISEGEPAAVAVNLAYPLGDLLLLGLGVGALGMTGWRPHRALLLVCGGFALAAVADGVFLYRAATLEYLTPTVFDALWPASLMLLAWAAWQHRARTLPNDLRGRRELLAPALFALIAVGLLAQQSLGAPHPVAAALATLTLLALVGRLALSLRANQKLLERTEQASVTDALTGLGNRRRLVDDLDAMVTVADCDSPLTLATFDLDGFKLYNDTFGHPEGDLLLARLGGRLAAAVAPYGRAYRVGGDEFCVLVDHGGGAVPESVVAAATAALSEKGDGFRVGSSHGRVVIPHDAATATRALKLADQRLYAEKEERPSSAGRQARDVLLRTLRERKPELHSHLQEVVPLVTAVGRRLGLTGRELTAVQRAAQLHDLGKVAIPDGILNKPGPLDAGEWEFMRRHPIIGEQILSVAPAMAEVACIVRSHHERYDGAGYPDGLAGERIPLGARIVAACDAYDAMVSERPYQPRISEEDAILELRHGAGRQFDPVVVDCLLEALRDESLLREIQSEIEFEGTLVQLPLPGRLAQVAGAAG